MDSYYIDKYPVTNQLFDKFVQEINYITEPEKNNMGRVRHGSRWEKMNGVSWRNPDGLKDNPGDILPVTQITWNDAKAYCQWAGKQLPTEAQWEKAARGPKGASYPWGEKEPDDSVANYNSYNDGITEVNMFDKGQSYYGVYDMAGNTLEWCRDGYTVYNNKKRASHNHFEKSDKKYRVVKGSAYSEGPSSLRASRRLQYKPDYSNNVLGFRCVKEK
jgi:formylglycine-generating enzyme required for sulfatase activity